MPIRKVEDRESTSATGPRMTLVLSKQDVVLLRQIATRNGLSVSAVGAMAIKQFLERYGEGEARLL
jgi:uncharacterized protein YdbL (DUF1318 family)